MPQTRVEEDLLKGQGRARVALLRLIAGSCTRNPSVTISPMRIAGDSEP